MKKIILFCFLVLIASVQPVNAMKKRKKDQNNQRTIACLVLLINLLSAKSKSLPKDVVTPCEKGMECFSCEGLEELGDKVVEFVPDFSCCDRYKCLSGDKCRNDLKVNMFWAKVTKRFPDEGSEYFFSDLGYTQKHKISSLVWDPSLKGGLNDFLYGSQCNSKRYALNYYNDDNILRCTLEKHGTGGGRYYFENNRVCCKNPKGKNYKTFNSGR